MGTFYPGQRVRDAKGRVGEVLYSRQYRAGEVATVVFEDGTLETIPLKDPDSLTPIKRQATLQSVAVEGMIANFGQAVLDCQRAEGSELLKPLVGRLRKLVAALKPKVEAAAVASLNGRRVEGIAQLAPIVEAVRKAGDDLAALASVSKGFDENLVKKAAEDVRKSILRLERKIKREGLQRTAQVQIPESAEFLDLASEALMSGKLNEELSAKVRELMNGVVEKVSEISLSGTPQEIENAKIALSKLKDRFETLLNIIESSGDVEPQLSAVEVAFEELAAIADKASGKVAMIVKSAELEIVDQQVDADRGVLVLTVSGGEEELTKENIEKLLSSEVEDFTVTEPFPLDEKKAVYVEIPITTPQQPLAEEEVKEEMGLERGEGGEEIMEREQTALGEPTARDVPTQPFTAPSGPSGGMSGNQGDFLYATAVGVGRLAGKGEDGKLYIEVNGELYDFWPEEVKKLERKKEEKKRVRGFEVGARVAVLHQPHLQGEIKRGKDGKLLVAWDTGEVDDLEELRKQKIDLLLLEDLELEGLWE